MKFASKDIVMAYDTDYQGVVHYASYFRFVTNALETFAAKHKLPSASFVTAEAHATYKKPLRVNDIIYVVIEPQVMSKKAIKFGFRIYKSKSKLLVAEGYVVEVAIGKNWHAVDMPASVLKRLKQNPD
ncbi:MAG: acyl-CoA thioesterase [Candidatus Micrarchaeia archaeon]